MKQTIEFKEFNEMVKNYYSLGNKRYLVIFNNQPLNFAFYKLKGKTLYKEK